MPRQEKVNIHVLPYSRKIWQGIKFGSLAVNRQIKIHQNFLLAYIHAAIPYRTTKFKSASIFAIMILGSTTKFNSCQYFQLYSIYMYRVLYNLILEWYTVTLLDFHNHIKLLHLCSCSSSLQSPHCWWRSPRDRSSS